MFDPPRLLDFITMLHPNAATVARRYRSCASTSSK
jgi:hypothetical protein